MAKRSQTRETLKRLNILARTSSPRWVRTAYRLARSVKLAPFSQPLPADLVKDCRVCADRVNMFHELPRNGVVAELGTYIGDFARLIVERTEPRELHLIDIDYSRFVDTGLTDARVKRHRGLTHEVIASFPDAYFDWIYVDADHSYNATLRDARASAPKLRPGGFLVFNDFAHIDPDVGRYGVHRAVVDFVLETRWPLALFAFHPYALYDVALQKPADTSSA